MSREIKIQTPHFSSRHLDFQTDTINRLSVKTKSQRDKKSSFKKQRQKSISFSKEESRILEKSFQLKSQPQQTKKLSIGNEDLLQIIQDIHANQIPDFGYEDNELFQEITGIHSNRPQSKWRLFYDCIRKHPRFEKLKKYIEETTHINRLKEQERQKRQIQDYMLSNYKNNAKKSQYLGVQWQDQSSFYNEIRQSSPNPQTYRQIILQPPSNNEKKMILVKNLMNKMQEQFNLSQENHNKIKTFIKYKPQSIETEQVINPKIQSKISYLWKSTDSPITNDSTEQQKNCFKFSFNKNFHQNNDIKDVIDKITGNRKLTEPKTQLNSITDKPEKPVSQTINALLRKSVDFEQIRQTQVKLADQLIKYLIEQIDLIKIHFENTLLEKQENFPKNQKKQLKRKLRYIQECILKLKDKDFSLINSQIYGIIIEDGNINTSQILCSLLYTLKKFYQLDNNEVSLQKILYKKLQHYNDIINPQNLSNQKNSLSISIDYNPLQSINFKQQRPLSQCSTISDDRRYPLLWRDKYCTSNNFGTQNMSIQQESNQNNSIVNLQSIEQEKPHRRYVRKIRTGSCQQSQDLSIEHQFQHQHRKQRKQLSQDIQESLYQQQLKNPYEEKEKNIQTKVPHFQLGVQIDKKLAKLRKSIVIKEQKKRKLMKYLNVSL